MIVVPDAHTNEPLCSCGTTHQARTGVAVFTFPNEIATAVLFFLSLFSPYDASFSFDSLVSLTVIRLSSLSYCYQTL